MLYRIVSATPSPILEIECIGYAAHPSNTRYPRIARPYYLIHYCISGKGYFNGHAVGRSEGFLIRPDQICEYYPDPGAPWEYVWIASRDSRIEPFLSEYDSRAKDGIFPFSGTRIVESLRDYVVHSCNRPVSGSVMLERFLHLYNDHQSKINSFTTGASYYDVATRYIQMNYHTRLRVKELTDLLGISQPYLHRLFTEACGMSAKAYINACRLDAAKKLLTTTDLCIDEIAAATGYEDPQSFFRFFAKNCYQTPTEFRRSHKKIAE